MHLKMPPSIDASLASINADALRGAALEFPYDVTHAYRDAPSDAVCAIFSVNLVVTFKALIDFRSARRAMYHYKENRRA